MMYYYVYTYIPYVRDILYYACVCTSLGVHEYTQHHEYNDTTCKKVIMCRQVLYIL